MTHVCKKKPKEVVTELWVCDVQAAFMGKIYAEETFIKRTSAAVSAARVFNWTVRVSEQVPSKLGKTTDRINVFDNERFSKTKFSMMPDECPPVPIRVILVGLEAHVCIRQTVLDCIKCKDVESVVLLVDAISSIEPLDKDIFLQELRMNSSRDGYEKLTLTTVQALIFGEIGDCQSRHFKDLSRIAKYC